MTQLIKKIVQNKFVIVGITSSFTSLLIFLLFINGLKFNNEIDTKDIVGLILNLLFVFFISVSINKNYDIHRKEKDVIINEIIEIKKNVKNGFEAIKNSRYSERESNKIITNLREDIYNLKTLIESSMLEKAESKTREKFTQIDSDLRSIDRVISPPSSVNRLINPENENQLENYSRSVLKHLSKLMLELNSI